MGFIIDRLKNGIETVKNPLMENQNSYGEIVLNDEACNNCGVCVKECIVGAISLVEKNVKIDHNKCLFCKECIMVCPTNALTMTNNYKLSSIEESTKEIRGKIYSKFKRSLVLRAVDVGSCNGCGLELSCTQNTFYDLSRYGVHIAASPRHADGIIVSGPVSINMKEALLKAYEAVAEPKIVIALGTCTSDSGIYKNGYAVSDNLRDIVPVDLFIPGCPPSPAAIIEGILKIMGRLQI